MTDELIIRTSSLNYHYSKKEQTIFDLDLQVKKGSIYGFLGPNGSGKTTTLSLLLGLLNNQQGQIEIFGKDLKKNRTDILRRIGSLIESPSLYGHLTAKENLEVYQPIYGVSKERIGEVLHIVRLGDTKKKPVKKFSLGMKQRLSIAIALLHSPELLILDEPSNGLDPAGIIELRQLIKKLNESFGMTILISSHILSEIEKMVTHVGIIFRGKLLFQGSMSELQTFQSSSARLRLQTSDNHVAMSLLQQYSPEMNGDSFTVNISGKQDISCINKMLTGRSLDVFLLQPQENNLEQLFINLTTELP